MVLAAGELVAVREVEGKRVYVVLVVVERTIRSLWYWSSYLERFGLFALKFAYQISSNIATK